MIDTVGPGKGFFRLRPIPRILIADREDQAKGTYLSRGRYHRRHVTRRSRGPDEGTYPSAGTVSRLVEVGSDDNNYSLNRKYRSVIDT